MTASDPWIANLEAELPELIEHALIRPLADHDRYRLLVLLARAAQLEAPTAPIERSLDLAVRHDLARRQLPCLPDAAQVLDALDTVLEQGDEPAGPLADALLDVDDLASVLWMLGRAEAAHEVAAEAEALVSAATDRVAPLSSWASNRLGWVADDHPVAAVWRTVQAAPVAALETLPVLSTALDQASLFAILDRADRRPRAGLSLFVAPAVQDAYRAAAAGRFESPEPYEGDDWVLYTDEDRLVLEVRLDGRRSRAVAELVVRDGGVEWRRPVRRSHVDPDRATYELPSTDELARWFVEARAITRQPSTSAPDITLEWVEPGDEP